MDFKERKAAAMAVLTSSAADKSPKGSLDAPIAPLIAALNRHPSLFSTSSCSGRITILSHPKAPNSTKKKAGGGRWLLASHDPADPEAVAALVFQDPAAGTAGVLVFRFEPLIIALECENAAVAQWLVSKAIACGFRESGITNLGKRIMVAVRCSIRMEVPLGNHDNMIVSPEYVKYLTEIANEKMEANRKRTEGFYQMLIREEPSQPTATKIGNGNTCKDHSRDRISRYNNSLSLPPSMNDAGIAFLDSLDEHDAESTESLKNNEEFHVLFGSLAVDSIDAYNNNEKKQDYPPGFEADWPNRLEVTNLEITGDLIERLFLWGHTSCIFNNLGKKNIIIFGGFGGVGRHARRNDTLMLEPESGILSAIDVQGAPSPRLGHTSSSIADQIFVIGGRCGPTEILNDVWALDTVNFMWRLLECHGNIFNPRHRHAAATIGTHIYVFGGLSHDIIYSCMHVLDTKTLHWSEVIAKGEWPSARHSHSLVAYGSQLFLFGGYDGEKALGDLHSFNVETLSWTKEKYTGRPPPPRFSHCSFVYKNILGILGGCPLTHGQQDISLLDLTHRVWKHIRVDSVGRGLWIRSSVNIVPDNLVIIGGGAACYAFGTKFNPPMKLSLLAFNEENHHSNHLKRFCDGKSNKKCGLLNTDCIKMSNSLSNSLVDKTTEKDGSRMEPRPLVLQLKKKYAKLGKDILKHFGWLDRGRKVDSQLDGSQICLPVTGEFREKWELCLAKKSEVICSDYLMASCLSKGANIDEISLLDAFALLFACGGSVINDDKPMVKKASRSPQKIMQDAVSSLIAERGLPQWLLQQLPTRWERLGDIIVLPMTSFKDPLWDTIAEELWPIVANSLNCHRLARQGRVLPTGTRDSTLEILVGQDGWVTHHENGIIYSFDATKCMFSAGNLSEKHRMSRLDCSSEIIVDLFAGIGYFVLPFLVKSNAKLVYACEWNPHALEALKRNVEVNAVANRCIVLEGDNRITAPKHVADRVCLGLLPTSEGSWTTAVRALKNEGGMLHIHGNANDSDELVWADHVVKSIDTIAKLEGYCWDVSLQNLERVKWYGPRIRHLVADVRCKQLC